MSLVSDALRASTDLADGVGALGVRSAVEDAVEHLVAASQLRSCGHACGRSRSAGARVGSAFLPTKLPRRQARYWSIDCWPKSMVQRLLRWLLAAASEPAAVNPCRDGQAVLRWVCSLRGIP